MKKFLSLVAVTSLAFATGNIVMPYGAYIDYSKESTKDYGIIGGVYFSKYIKNSKLELDLEHTFISFKSYSKFARDNHISTSELSYNTNDYHQSDVTFIFNIYGPDVNLKIGNHSLFIDQDENDDTYDNVVIAGLEYYKYLKYNIGADAFYSHYDNFTVKQVSPYFGYNFGNYYSEYGSFYAKMMINFIRISNKNVTGKENYINYDFSLTNYIDKWSTTIKASIGKSAYKVENGGYVVYNLGEEYKNSFGVNVNYKIDNVSNVGGGFTYSNFKEGVDASSMVFLLNYSRAF